MKKITITILSVVIIILVLPVFAEAKTTSVRGYFKPSIGRYIQPHYKTSPNKTKIDNYSSKYNYNPYTGKKGTVDPFKYKFRY